MADKVELDNQPRFIDSHIHLDFDEFDAIRQPLMEALTQAGLNHCVIPATSSKHWVKQLQVASEYDASYALGIHPWYCQEQWQGEIAQLKTLVEHHHQDKRFVAIGECGLDAIRASKNSQAWQWQLDCFKAQIQLAKIYQLPLILHSVKAHNEVLTLLREYAPLNGVIHGFYGGIELAQQYISCGFKLGISHLLLNDRAEKLQSVVSHLPLTSFVIETDVALLQERNRLQMISLDGEFCLVLPQLIKKIAKLQKKSSVLISEQLFLNAVQLFEL